MKEIHPPIESMNPGDKLEKRHAIMKKTKIEEQKKWYDAGWDDHMNYSKDRLEKPKDSSFWRDVLMIAVGAIFTVVGVVWYLIIKTL